MMNLELLLPVAPLAILSVAGLACLMALSFARAAKGAKSSAAFAVCALALALALAADLAAIVALAAGAAPSAPAWAQGLLSLDGLSLLGMAIVLVSALAVALSSRPYLARGEGEQGEYYALLLFASLGAAILCASSNLATLFLALELLSVCLYAMVGYRRDGREGSQAAFTYLILASAASAFLLFGMALTYFQGGSLELSRLTRIVAEGSGGPLAAAGLAMIGVGFGFKLAIAPFHMWAPEVYEGAPAPVAGLIASLSKAAMALPLIRLLAPAASGSSAAAAWTIAALSAVSMFAGNLIALREEKVKRMLAGSSIAQLGYILVALLGGGSYGAGAALFYLAAYALASLAAFGCVATLSRGHEECSREDFRSLASRRPFVAVCMTAALLSLAGLPLTAGFVGKYLLFASDLGAGAAGAASLSARQILAVLLALNSAMSLFYYLRLVSVMYRKPSPVVEGAIASLSPETPSPGTLPMEPLPTEPAASGSAWAGAALAALIALLLVLGTVPGPAMAVLARLASL